MSPHSASSPFGLSHAQYGAIPPPIAAGNGMKTTPPEREKLSRVYAKNVTPNRPSANPVIYPSGVHLGASRAAWWGEFSGGLAVSGPLSVRVCRLSWRHCVQKQT